MESRERYRYRRAQSGDDEFHDAIRAQQRFGLVLIASIGPSPDDDAAAAEPEHEDGDDERRGLDGGAEDVPELADPDDLVDESADPGQEEQNEEHPGRIPEWSRSLGLGWGAGGWGWKNTVFFQPQPPVIVT